MTEGLVPRFYVLAGKSMGCCQSFMSGVKVRVWGSRGESMMRVEEDEMMFNDGESEKRVVIQCVWTGSCELACRRLYV